MWHWPRCIWNTFRKSKGRCIKRILSRDWNPLVRLRREMWSSIHPSIGMQVGFKPILLRRSSGEEGAGREDGAGEAHQYLKERQMKREGKRQKRNGGQGPENPGECGH